MVLLSGLGIPHPVHAMRMDGDRSVAGIIARRIECLEIVLGKLRQSAAGLVVRNGRSDDGRTTLVVGSSCNIDYQINIKKMKRGYAN